jgi:asparagine synthase (glutamine-hydrolysing)
MGALVAVASKTRESTFATAVIMLDALSLKGDGSCGIASSEEVIVKQAVDELRRGYISSAALIGHKTCGFCPNDEAQPVRIGNCTFIFEGRLLPPRTGQNAGLAAKQASTQNGALRFIRRFNGSYIFAANVANGIIIGRDVVGACPLYYGEDERICAAASERKALWKIGLTAVSSFPPGTVALINERGFHFATAKTLKQPPVQRVNLRNAAKRLAKILAQSTREQVADTEEVAVAFSGGVDSCIIAHLVSLWGVTPHLIYVTLQKPRGADPPEEAAQFLGLPLHVAEYSIEEVEKSLPDVLWLVEEPNPLTASIALPLFWVAQQAAGLGLHVLMTGQGADELFGGYARYLGDCERHGLAYVRGRIYRDVVSSYTMNLERDYKVCAFHKVEPRMPFNSPKVIELALSLPVGLNIASPRDKLRKRVLRQVARNLAIPEFVSERPKSAIQYTTGVSLALKKLAAREKISLHEYVETIFKRVCCGLREDD